MQIGDCSTSSGSLLAVAPSALAAALRDRYVLERELGRGGMATVYLARDLRHDRPVALKVLHPELAATLGPERFLREVRLTARLQHPHILTVHDSGEAAGQLWYTMPYVEGESLRDRLTRDRQLPLDDALQIARNVLAALAYAHSHGVIHRDIKPENVLLEAGEAVVADFGIARAVSAAGGEHLTQTGMSVGTPAYMSPEQAAGGSEVDGRSDVYSLGCVLYEMLAGEPPYTGPTPQAILAKRILEPIPHLRTVRESVPEAVEQAVTKALAKVPADRFQTAQQFADVLSPTNISAPITVAPPRAAAAAPAARRRRSSRWLAVLSAGILVIFVGIGLVVRELHSRRYSAAPGPKMLAVLPFENLGRAEDEYFADGLTEEITSRLASVHELGVISRTSSMQYKKTPKSLRQIGKELGAGYVLEGSVRWEKPPSGSSRIRVTPQLIEVADDRHLWADRYDAELADVFEVQGRIAEQVAQALDVALAAGERHTLSEKPTKNLAAYDAYLKGREVGGSGEQDPAKLRRALRYYEQAVALDSSYALAWAKLAEDNIVLYANGAVVPGEAERARQAAERAVALAPDHVDGHLVLAVYYQWVQHDNVRALEEFGAAQRLAPSNVDVLWYSAALERSLGHWEAAVEHFRQSLALDPRSPSGPFALGITLFLLRRYPEALQAIDRGLALASTNIGMVVQKAQIFLAKGDLGGARDVLQAASSTVEPTALVAFVSANGDLTWVLNDDQQRLLLRLTPSEFDNNRASWGLALASAYALRGDNATARVYADSARIALEAQLQAAPDDGLLHALDGVALAYLGRRADAVHEGERGLALLPVATDVVLGPEVQGELVRVYTILGMQEKALDQLEELLRIPSFLSPGWLRIDAAFAPLRGNPRFRRLLDGQP